MGLDVRALFALVLLGGCALPPGDSERFDLHQRLWFGTDDNEEIAAGETALQDPLEQQHFEALVASNLPLLNDGEYILPPALFWSCDGDRYTRADAFFLPGERDPAFLGSFFESLDQAGYDSPAYPEAVAQELFELCSTPGNIFLNSRNVCRNGRNSLELALGHERTHLVTEFLLGETPAARRSYDVVLWAPELNDCQLPFHRPEFPAIEFYAYLLNEELCVGMETVAVYTPEAVSWYGEVADTVEDLAPVVP